MRCGFAPEATVEDGLQLFFSTLASNQDRGNWRVKALSPDRALLDIVPETLVILAAVDFRNSHAVLLKLHHTAAAQ